MATLKLQFLALLLVSTEVGYAAKAPAKNPPAADPQTSSLQQQNASLQEQRKSLNQQSGVKPEEADDFIPPFAVFLKADCARLPDPEIENLVAAAAKKQSLQPALIRAVMRQESGFKPCAVSVKGAQGLMQLMPATATQLHVADPFDPKQNVEAGAAFLKQLLGKYNGDLRLALIAYNAGANRVDDSDSPLPAETQNYIASIFAALGISQQEGPAAEKSSLDGLDR